MVLLYFCRYFIYTSFSVIETKMTKLFFCLHFSEMLPQYTKIRTSRGENVRISSHFIPEFVLLLDEDLEYFGLSYKPFKVDLNLMID